MARKKNLQVVGGDILDSLRRILSDKCGVVHRLSSQTPLAGIAIPSLAVQWGVNANILPLSRCMEITGVPGIGKSTFLYEIMRWLLLHKGHTVLFETESKDNSAMRNAIFQYDPLCGTNTTTVEVASMDQWVNGILAAMTYYQDVRDSGEQLPVLFAVDSLVAAEVESAMEKETDGTVSSGGFPGGARFLSVFCKRVTNKIMDHPFLLVFTNHIKKEIGASGFGPPKEYRTGGRAIESLISLSVKLSPAARGSYNPSGVSCKGFRVNFLKNSIGADRDIDIYLVYGKEANPTYVEEDWQAAPTRQTAGFDWYATDIIFLMEIQKGSNRYDKYFYSADKRQLASVIDLLPASKGVKKDYVSSSVLGIPEDKPVTYTEAGRLLWANDALVRSIQDVLQIVRHPVYIGGADYRDMLDARQSYLEKVMQVTSLEIKETI